MMEVEFMSLDEVIKKNKEGKKPSSPGSCITAMSRVDSMASCFSLGRGAFRGVGRPKQPLAYDWTWVVGEEIQPRPAAVDAVDPPQFVRGRGGWKIRGRGFRQTYHGRGRVRFQAGGFIRRGRGGRGGFQHRYGYQPRFQQQAKLPVHMRLGWVTPARRYAMHSLKTASYHLNRRPAPFVARNDEQRMFVDTSRNTARFQQLRQLRGMMTDDDTESVITVSVHNELATARGRGASRGARRGGPRRGFNGARTHMQLSQQNVARLGNLTTPMSVSNRSQYSTHRSRASSNRTRASYKSRKPDNQRMYSERQLPSSVHSASLQSVQRRLNTDGFLVPATPGKPHLVTLDKKLQQEIANIQAKLDNPDLHRGKLDYKPASITTTTSTSDRFSLMSPA